jgi:hypothetical protein
MKTLITLLVVLGINAAIPISARDYLEDLKNGGPEYAHFLKFEMEIRAKLDPEALALRHQYKQWQYENASPWWISGRSVWSVVSVVFHPLIFTPRS